MAEKQSTKNLIINAVERRQSSSEMTEAYRLFNGFYEGFPGLVIDRYGPALVIFNHGMPAHDQTVINEFTEWAMKHIKSIKSVLLKTRQHPDEHLRNGILIAGNELPNSIAEFGVDYALDMQMNQDASFYLDTRNLRRWLLDNLKGVSVLNTFAYTGSLGVAAGAGGAKKVIQTDITRKFLDVAQSSWDMNDLSKNNCDILPGDFFRVTGRMRNDNLLFGCVILDPPFFSTTDAGKVDLEEGTTRLINKVRPLVAHEGWLVVINNALFHSGQDFMKELNTLCKSKYLAFHHSIPIPPDVTGYPDTIVSPPPVNPAPFNHPTKIAILKAFRKDEHKSTDT